MKVYWLCVDMVHAPLDNVVPGVPSFKNGIVRRHPAVLQKRISRLIRADCSVVEDEALYVALAVIVVW